MLLAHHGWRPADIERAKRTDPEMIEAARFALFAETLAPEYAACREVLDIDMSSIAKSEKGAVGKRKMKARTQLANLRRVLLLDAED